MFHIFGNFYVLAMHKILIVCYKVFYVCTTRCISLWASPIACVEFFQHRV